MCQAAVLLLLQVEDEEVDPLRAVPEETAEPLRPGFHQLSADAQMHNAML